MAAAASTAPCADNGDSPTLPRQLKRSRLAPARAQACRQHHGHGLFGCKIDLLGAQVQVGQIGLDRAARHAGVAPADLAAGQGELGDGGLPRRLRRRLDGAGSAGSGFSQSSNIQRWSAARATVRRGACTASLPTLTAWVRKSSTAFSTSTLATLARGSAAALGARAGQRRRARRRISRPSARRSAATARAADRAP